MQAVYEHGTFPDIDTPVDETNILVNSFSAKATRKKKDWLGATNKATSRLRYYDPILTLSFDGFVSALAGLAIQHPGTTISSLANYATDIHGFDADDGVIVYEDPEDTAEIEEMLKIKFDAVHYPFVD